MDLVIWYKSSCAPIGLRCLCEWILRFFCYSCSDCILSNILISCLDACTLLWKLLHSEIWDLVSVTGQACGLLYDYNWWTRICHNDIQIQVNDERYAPFLLLILKSFSLNTELSCSGLVLINQPLQSLSYQNLACWIKNIHIPSQIPIYHLVFQSENSVSILFCFADY
jgi:hypothetical protein